ncbi:MAG: hypothetical protein Q8K86_01550 [Candidatus Nanopelagicaceae bacterium]|nr:hypothetical protein [Candidatus Nanopelagicaceae bacterium]
MITLERCLQRVQGLSSEGICDLVCDRLTGRDVSIIGNHPDENPEDLVVLLLNSAVVTPMLQLNVPIRAAAVEGCRRVLADIMMGMGKRDMAWTSTLKSLSRTLNIAAPEELRETVFALFDAALKIDDTTASQYATMAVMRYNQGKEITSWEAVMKNYPNLAAYAFNTLLRYVADPKRIEGYLVFLWTGPAWQKESIDVAFLMRRAQREHTGTITAVLKRLREHPSWEQIEHHLKSRKWSKEWLVGEERER